MVKRSAVCGAHKTSFADKENILVKSHRLIHLSFALSATTLHRPVDEKQNCYKTELNSLPEDSLNSKKCVNKSRSSSIVASFF
jgi:hypothetical protein